MSGLSRRALRALRGDLRRERERILGEAIARGPSPALCDALSALEQRERDLAREELRRRRRGRSGRLLLAFTGFGALAAVILTGLGLD